MKLGFLFTNPKHHAEMMLPIAAELRRRGHQTQLVSLAELRGFTTPSAASLPSARDAAPELVAAIPWQLRKSPQHGAEFGADGAGAKGTLRRAAQRAVVAALLPRLAWLLRGCDAVLVPNDSAYPYRDLVDALRLARKPVALLQEGIRFPLPSERAARAGNGASADLIYGGSGLAAVCAWGEGSAEHFRKVARGATRVHVTGNPRFDDVDVASFREQGRALMRELRFGDGPFLYMSNPVDDQRFCTTAEKLQLFERFVERAAPELVRRAAPLVVKLHPREDAEAFRRSAAKAPVAVHVADRAPLFAWLAVARGAVVLASTVGLEALRFGVPLGVLPLPTHGHVFEYASRGAAVPLSLDALEPGVAEIFDGAAARAPAAAALIERHLGAPAHAAARVADVLEQLGSRRAAS